MADFAKALSSPTLSAEDDIASTSVGVVVMVGTARVSWRFGRSVEVFPADVGRSNGSGETPVVLVAVAEDMSDADRNIDASSSVKFIVDLVIACANSNSNAFTGRCDLFREANGRKRLLRTGDGEEAREHAPAPP